MKCRMQDCIHKNNSYPFRCLRLEDKARVDFFFLYVLKYIFRNCSKECVIFCIFRRSRVLPSRWCKATP